LVNYLMSFRSDTIYISSDTDIGNGVCIEAQENGLFSTVNELVTLKKSPGQYFDGSETDLSKICDLCSWSEYDLNDL